MFNLEKPKWNPHDYQLSALKKMMNQGSIGLFLDPGLGKTSICLSAFRILKDKGIANKMLIIAPLRPCYVVWPTEIEKWANFEDFTYSIVHGNDKEESLRAEADIYIINPDGLLWLFDPRYKRWLIHKFDVLVVDESTKFKNTSTRRFKAIRPHLPSFKRRWCLTGTPAPNGVADLFGQVLILDGGASLGKYITHFRNTFFYRAGFHGYDWFLRPGAFDDIMGKIKPLIYQLSAKDHLKMPELVVVDVPVQMPEKAMKIYQEVEDSFITLLVGDTPLVASNAAAAGTKCRQVANGAVYLDNDDWIPIHDAKLDALEDLIEELLGKPVLVLYEFVHDWERIQIRFPKAEFIGSGVNLKKLDSIVSRFNAGTIPILVGHPASMGHGLNLQGTCHHVIWYGITWNLEHYDQTIARVWRQGQKSGEVFIYRILAQETLDQKVAKVLAQKGRTQDAILDSLKGQV